MDISKIKNLLYKLILFKLQY